MIDHLFFTGINILLAWSAYIVLLSGSLSFAQGAFMAIGCYIAGVLTVKFGWALEPALVVAAFGTAFIGAAIGYPALRTRGLYLILLTVGVTFVVRVGLEQFEYVGGVLGFGGMLGATVWHVGVAVVIVGAALCVLSVSPWQRVLDAIREDEAVAESLGINAAKVSVACFSAGAGVAAIAGGLYGHYMAFVRPEIFDILISIFVVLYVILGGVNNMWGAVLGAAILTLVPEYVRVLSEWRPTAYGVVIVLLLLFRPMGLLTFRIVTVRLPNSPRETASNQSA